uniref:AAA_5 domain-containing protein n=1 Tax=Anisakis simplex TaxID=6269 RepID=A0A0M3J2S6_ANISI
LNRIGGEKESKLEEHRQWLNDANNRVNDLENVIKDKDGCIDSLQKEIEELKTVKLVTPEGDLEGELKQVREAMQKIEDELHNAQKALSEAPNVDEFKLTQWFSESLTLFVRESPRQFQQEDIYTLICHFLVREAMQKIEDELHNAQKALSEAPNVDEFNWLKSEHERLCNEMNEKNRIIDDLNRIRDEKEWSLGEHRQWLTDANNRADGLENACKDKENTIESLRKEIEELRSVTLEAPQAAVRIKTLESELHDAQQALTEGPKQDDVNALRSENDRLTNEINEKNRIIDDLNRIRDEKEWTLGEHRQWLNDANNRFVFLVFLEFTTTLALHQTRERIRDKDRTIDQLKEEIEHLSSMTYEASLTAVPDDELKRWQSEVDRLGNEINEKNRIIDDLNRIRDEKEWKLGEHRQWLEDANNRANGLEDALRDKNNELDALHKEIDELKKTIPESVEATPGVSVDEFK